MAIVLKLHSKDGQTVWSSAQVVSEVLELLVHEADIIHILRGETSPEMGIINLARWSREIRRTRERERDRERENVGGHLFVDHNYKIQQRILGAEVSELRDTRLPSLTFHFYTASPLLV